MADMHPKKMRSRLPLLLILFAPLTVPASPTAKELTELFLLPQFSDPMLSPDGAYLAFMARRGDTYSVGIYSFATRHMDFSAGDSKTRPTDFWWKGPRRLLVETSSYKLDALGYTAFDADGKNNEDVWRIARQPGGIRDALPNEPRHILMSTRREVVRVNIDNEHQDKLSGGLEGGVDYWIIDEQGRPRGASEHDWQFGDTQIWWRGAPDGPWTTRKFARRRTSFFPRPWKTAGAISSAGDSVRIRASPSRIRIR
jgi:hypothetical protein